MNIRIATAAVHPHRNCRRRWPGRLAVGLLVLRDRVRPGGRRRGRQRAHSGQPDHPRLLRRVGGWMGWPRRQPLLLPPGDSHYYYPAGQRTYKFAGADEDEAKALGADGPAIKVVKDNITLMLSGTVTFSLNTDCDVLKKFHQQIGVKKWGEKKKAAWISDGGDESYYGWDAMLDVYIEQPLQRAATDALLAEQKTYLDLYNGSGRAEFEQAIQADLPGSVGGPAWLRREPGRWQLLRQLQGSDPEAVHPHGCGGGSDREGDRQGAERSPEARQRDGTDRAGEYPGPRGGAGAAGVHRLPAQQAVGAAAGAAEAGHRERQGHHPAGSHRLERDHPHDQVTK